MNVETTEAEPLIDLDIERIVVNPFQPRRSFSEEELGELAHSIQSVGLLHPPLVRPSSLLPGFFELISGERRFRAWKKLGKKTMPVFVRRLDDTIAAQAALMENIHRTDLNPIEVATSLEKLLRKNQWTQEELALRIGKKRSTIANYIRLLDLAESAQRALREGAISMGHAKAILALRKEWQETLLREIILRQMSVREAEQWTPSEKPRPKKKDIFLSDVLERLQHSLGTKVAIHGSPKRGKIAISYYNTDDLNRLVDILDIHGGKENGSA